MKKKMPKKKKTLKQHGKEVKKMVEEFDKKKPKDRGNIKTGKLKRGAHRVQLRSKRRRYDSALCK